MMNQRSFDPKTHTRRNSNRLPAYDYRSSGAYFVTICTDQRQPFCQQPELRQCLVEAWQGLPERFPGVKLDEFVIMPDHVHFILWLDGSGRQRARLARVVGAYKSVTTVLWLKDRKARGIRCPAHLWQRDYYDHVIRNEQDLELTREYIVNNPLKALLMQEQRDEEVKRERSKGDGGRPQE